MDCLSSIWENPTWRLELSAGSGSQFAAWLEGIIQGNGQDDAQGADDEKAPVFPKQQLESCLK